MKLLEDVLEKEGPLVVNNPKCFLCFLILVTMKQNRFFLIRVARRGEQEKDGLV